MSLEVARSQAAKVGRISGFSSRVPEFLLLVSLFTSPVPNIFHTANLSLNFHLFSTMF
jgi:hypothetical protein